MIGRRRRARSRHDPVADPVGFVNRRLGAAPLMKKALSYVFPDHWSFLLGEIALYSFVVLLLTGTYMALFFVPSSGQTVYHGTFAPLQGLSASEAYVSTVRLSFDVPAGLLIRQTHHWAANLFIAAIVIHVMRVFWTGAFRKPREVNWIIGVTMLMLAILEGFAGYSLPDDLLSGMGLVIGYSVALATPLVGGQLGTLVWDGRYPGGDDFWPRLFIAHVFVIPAILAALITVHLAIIMRQHHAQFPGPGRQERNVVGTPMWPGYALRSLGWFAAVAAVLVLMGGLIQINPIFQWGPYETWQSTNGAQPDWYLGWLIGGLRLMPPLEPRFWGHTWIPNPFWGGALFPLICFATLYTWPWFEQRFITRDRRRHDLLDRPRDNPLRTAIGAAFFAWVFLIFVAGAADRIAVSAGISYVGQVWVFRALVFVAPVMVGWATHRICTELRDSGRHPLRAQSGRRLRRTAGGGFAIVTESTDQDPPSRRSDMESGAGTG